MSALKKVVGKQPLWYKSVGDIALVGPTLPRITFWLTGVSGFLLGAWIF